MIGLGLYFANFLNFYISFSKKSAVEKLWRDDGRCGGGHKLPNGEAAQCNPNVRGDLKGPCCSPHGYCGETREHCGCEKCVDYSKLKVKKQGMS